MKTVDSRRETEAQEWSPTRLGEGATAPTPARAADLIGDESERMGQGSPPELPLRDGALVDPRFTSIVTRSRAWPP
jgi:hypothetical protein